MLPSTCVYVWRPYVTRETGARARKQGTRRGLHNSNSGSDESRLSRNVFSMNNSGRVVYTSDDIRPYMCIEKNNSKWCVIGFRWMP